MLNIIWTILIFESSVTECYQHTQQVLTKLSEYNVKKLMKQNVNLKKKVLNSWLKLMQTIFIP